MFSSFPALSSKTFFSTSELAKHFTFFFVSVMLSVLVINETQLDFYDILL